ncbi:hypothetical protein LEP1GSC170_0309, partial [Leptospira interrogans serovar Bataviae str. HAI135]
IIGMGGYSTVSSILYGIFFRKKFISVSRIQFRET